MNLDLLLTNKDSAKSLNTVKKRSKFSARKSIMLMFGDKSAANVIFEQAEDSSNHSHSAIESSIRPSSVTLNLL